jgi:hypothetical protein
MRALPSWLRATAKFKEGGFGSEMAQVVKIAASLGRMSDRYATPLDVKRLIGAFEAGLSRGFDRALSTHGAVRNSEQWAVLHQLFQSQQRRRTSLWEDNSTEWPFTSPDHPLASLLLPRPNLYREALRDRTRMAIGRKPTDVEGRRGQVTGLIEHEVGCARRVPGGLLRDLRRTEA